MSHDRSQTESSSVLLFSPLPQPVSLRSSARSAGSVSGFPGRTRRLRWILGCALAALTAGLGAPGALGQFGASMNGTVADATGAVVPGATITLTNTATSQSRTATSSASGAYTFSELPPGNYTVTATAAGFKKATLNNIAVAAETPRTANITLDTGGTTETVTVDADTTAVLQTSDASIGNTINSEAIERLPTNGGDPYELLRTAPGITGDSARSGAGTSVFLPNGAGAGQSNEGVFQTENQVQISADGQSVGANNYMIDGVSVNSLGQAGAAVVTPNQESVGQMTVLSTSYSAEDGRNSGAQIKVVSKSGTNTVHGSAYFRYDQPGLNAYNKSLQAQGDTFAGPPLRVSNVIRDWAGSLGGPILKDKLFLFVSYEGFKLTSNTYANQFIETPQFDAAVLATNPNSVTSQIIGSGGVTPRVVAILTPTCSYYTQAAMQNASQTYGCQIVGNGMDVGSFGTAANNGTYFPQNSYEVGAGLDGVPDLQYVQLLEPSRGRGNQYNARGDWYATPKDQFAMSAYITKLDNYGTSGATGSRPQGDVPLKPLNSAETFLFIHTFTPTLLNEFRANATRFADNEVTDGAGTVNYGIPYIDVQNIPGGNDVEYGAQQATTTPAILAENTYEVRDAVTKTFGAHTLKMGGEYRWEQDNNNLAGDARPVYSFNGLFDFANSAPVYEGIDANPADGGLPNTARYLRSQTLGLFVQHDWKVSPTLTVNTGVRYEYFSPIHNKGMDVNLPVLGPAGSELTAAALTPHYNFYNPDYTGFSPKVGFAWSPNGKLVVRGGVARAMNRLNFSLFDPAVEDGPGFFKFGACCGSAASPFAAGTILYEVGSSPSPFSYAPNPALVSTTVNGLPVMTSSTGVVTPIPIEVYGAQPNLRIPYAYLYSLEVQYQLPKTFVLTVGFQGSEAHHLPRLVNQNFLYAQPTNIVFNAAYFAQDDSNSNYAAGNIHLAKTLRHGYQLDAVYTYSKSLDQISNGLGADSLANQTNPAVNRTEWGPSDYDTRHRLTVTGLWTIPGTHLQGGMGNKVANIVTNGWQINGIFTFHTGFPFTPVVANVASNPFVTSAATITPTRPYQYFGGFVSSCSNSNFINGNDVKNASFTLAPPTGVPNTPGIGRNSFVGPCYMDTDLSAARQQKFEVLGKTFTLRFQANAFNVFNQLTLSPFTNGNAGGAAQIVGANPANPADAAARAASNFGRPTSADAGRQIEFFARLFF